METQAISATPIPTPAQAIGLRIAGADLLLSGRFEQWVPLALAEGKEEGAVQLLLDVTSTPRGRRNDGRELFSFSSTEVEAVAPQQYRAKGKLRSGGVTRAAEALLHSPVGHTPFFIMTLPIDRAHFPDLWTEMEDRAAAAQDSADKDLRPRAWLRVPELAAA
jgi:hypothetical protein